MKILANLPVDHQRAKALHVGEFTPPVLFYVSMLACGHWQMQRAEPETFVHEGGELACAACAAKSMPQRRTEAA